MRKYLAKVLSIGLALSIVLSSFVLTPVLAGASYNRGLSDIFAGASDTAKEANPWEYKTYLYGRREGIYNTPKVSVTYTGDNTVKVVARYNPQGENWGGRPYYGITVPNGFNMPEKIIRREFYGSEQIKYAEIPVADWPSSSRFSEIGTNKIGYEWRNRVTTTWGYDGDEDEFNRRFKTKTQALFLSWEKTGASIYELEYTTTVKDFKAQNNVLATFSQVLNRYSRHGGVYAARPKPVPPPPPAPKMSETYDLKRPAPLPVADPANALTSDEQNQVIQKIKEANPGLENIAAVSYDAGAKTFKVVFNKDQSEIVVPQKDLVYKKPAPKLDPLNLPFKLGEKVMLPNENAYNALGAGRESYSAKKEVLARFLKANGNDVRIAENSTGGNSYGVGLDNWTYVKYFPSGGYTPDISGSGIAGVRGTDDVYYFLGDNAITRTGMKVYKTEQDPESYPQNLVDTTTVIPFSRLFTYPNDPNNSDPNAITPDDKNDIRDAINRILDPNKFPGIDGVDTARDNLLNQVDGKNTREELNALLEEANNKASEFAIALANKKLDLDKEHAKKVINGLTELSEERKQALIREVDALRVSDQKSYDTAKTELNGIVNTALTEDLTAAKGSAENVVGKLPNPITDNSDKDVFKPTEVTDAISRIETDNLTETTHAEKIAEINKLKEKAQIDSAREEMLKKLADSNLLNKDELSDAIINNVPDGAGTQADQTAKDKIDEAAKALEKAKADAAKDAAKKKIDEILPPGTGHDDKANELKEKIDNAKSTDEIESILEEARVHKEKANALAKIEALTHLNQAQKNAYKELINNVKNQEDLTGYLDDAAQLDNSMASLIAEVNKSKGIKDGNQAPYNGASANTKQTFETALNEATPVITLTNADSSVNLDYDAVNALLNKLQKARLALAPDGTTKDDATLARNRAEEIKAALREKNKQVKEEIKTLKDDYSGFAALGNKDNPDEVGTIINEAERKIDAELAKLNNGTSADAVNAAISRIQAETETALAKEKVKAAIEKLTANINQQTDTNDKTPESIKAFNDAKQAGESVKTEAQAAVDSPRTNAQELARAYDKVVAADQAVTEKRNSLQDNADIAGLNAKIAELDALTQKARPTKFVTDNTKQAATTKISEANTTLGNAQDPSTARGLAAKPKPTKEEVDRMIETLTEKINALNTALTAERTEAKIKVNEIVTALFPENSATNEAQNKATYLAEAEKLITDSTGVAATNPDQFIDTLLTNATTAAVDGYAHLNDAQKNAAKADLLAKAKAVTANGNVNDITTAVSTLDTLNDKMEQVGKLKAQSEKVKAQVKYLKESNNTEKTAFDDAVTALTFDDNKTATQLDTLISNYNTALGALDGKASAPTAENRVSVANPKAITDDEKTQILDAIIAANPTIASKIDRNASSVTPEGVVTLVYNDGATVGADNVPATASTTFTAAEVLKASFNPPAKVLVSLGPDGNLTPADKETVKEAVLKANKTLSESNPPQLSKENITVNDDGSISVNLPNRNQTETVSAENAVDKTTKPTALTTVGNKKTEVEKAIDGMNLTPEVAEKLKAELSKSKLKAENAITNAQTDLEDVAHKDTAYTTATTAVATAVSTAELEMEKIKAKAELEKRAKEQKAAVDQLTSLSEANRTALKDAIDQALATAKQNVDQAQDSNAVTTAKDDGLLAIDKVKAKGDIHNKGEEIKAQINAMTGLTEDEKRQAGENIDNLVRTEGGKVDTATSTTLNDVVNAATETLNREKLAAEGQNLESLKVQIATLDSLLEQVAPTKFVTDAHKNAVQTAQNEARTSLGDQNNPTSAKGIAAKQNPTQDEINAMITTLKGKITALTTALDDSKADAKNKLDQIVGALFPQKNGAEDPNKATYLAKVAKLTADLQADDPDKNTISTTPDDYISTLLTDATAVAVDGYTHLNDAQKAAHKTSLENAANAITADGNVDTITTAIAGLKVLDDKMDEVAKLKEKGDRVKEQVKYIKEGTEAEKTAFDDAVTALTNVSTAATGENKDVAGLNELITNYNNALGNLNGEAVKPDPNDRVIVINPNQLTTEEKNKILDKIIAKNNDIAAKIDRDNSQVSDTGVVTLVYKDGATTTANETVEKTGDTTFQPNDVLIPQFTKPAKTLVSLGENGNLSAADKAKVKEAVLAANPELVAMQPPLLTENNIEVADDGTITVTFDNNYTETVEADKAVDKTTKPTAMNTLTTKKDGVNASLNALGLSETAANRIQGELNTLFTTASEAIANVHTDLTAQDKEAAYNTAVGKVAPLLETAKLDMDKLLAKAELEKRAETQKAAVDALQPLDETKRNEWKAAIDQALNEAKAAIDQAQDNAAITTAKDAGQLAIDKLKGKAEIQNKGEEVKQAIDAMPSLTPAQKAEAKATVDNLVQSETAKVEGATADTLNGVVDAAKLALDKEKAKADLKDRAEEAKAHIDGLTSLTQEQKDAAKAEVENTLTEELGKVENATADTLANVLENGMTELDQDRAKADLKDRAEEAKAHIDGLTNLTQEQKDAAKAEVENTLTEELGKVENATADTLVNVLENGMTELDQDRAKADVKDKAEEIKKHIATLTHLTEAQREAANNAVNKIVEVATTALENAAADDIEELIKNAKFDLDQEKAKADLIDKGEAIKTHIDSLSDLTDDQKTAEKAKVDATVAEENAKIEALEPTGTPEENATALENAVNSANAELDQDKAKADLLNKGENIKKHIDSLSDLTDDQKTAEKAKVDATVTEESNKIENLPTNGTPEENATALENAVNSANAELDQDKAKADLLNKGENIKKHIDGLSDLTDDQKTAEKAKVDATVTEESDKIENLPTNGTPEENATALENAVNSANAELDQDKAKADLLNKGENIKKHIDGLSDLTDDQKTAEKTKVDATVTEESNKIENLSTNGTPEENATALENAVNSANAELDQDKAKADLLNKGEELKDYIDHMKHLSKEQKEKAKEAIDQDVAAGTEAIENLPTNGTPEANATALENTVNIANAELDKEKAKAELLNEAEKIKDYVDILSTLNDDQKKDFKDQVDKVVAEETAALDAIVPTGDADADREAIQSEKDRADGLLKEIKDNVIETAKPILLGGEEEEYNPWVKLVFDQEKETEKDRVPNTGAHR